MNESQQLVYEKLPQSDFWKKQFTTVTLFSKSLAAVLLIVLPCVGFYLGYLHGTAMGGNEQTKAILYEINNARTLEKTREDFYIDSFPCKTFAGEFCFVTISIDGKDVTCYLGTSEDGMTTPYPTKEDLITHCRNEESEQSPQLMPVDKLKFEPITNISKWRVYVGDNDRFSFAYPPEWKKQEFTLDGRIDSVALSPLWESDSVSEYPETDFPLGLVWVWTETGICNPYGYDKMMVLEGGLQFFVTDYMTGDSEPNPTWAHKHVVEACFQRGEERDAKSVTVNYVSDMGDDKQLDSFWQVISTFKFPS